MHPLSPPPPCSLTPPSLFPASEVFEDILQGFDAMKAFENAPQDHGKSVFLLDVKSYFFSQEGVPFCMTHQSVRTWKVSVYGLVSTPLMNEVHI